MPYNIKYLATAGFDFYSEPCTESGTATCSGLSGSIELELGWQLVAVPQQYGYWDSVTHTHVHDDITLAKFENYILDQITDLYGTGIVQVANTYPGDLQAFYSYVVGSTPTSSPHNFQMVYDDGVNKEISGWWIKIIGAGAPYTITWGNY